LTSGNQSVCCLTRVLVQFVLAGHMRGLSYILLCEIVTHAVFFIADSSITA